MLKVLRILVKNVHVPNGFIKLLCLFPDNFPNYTTIAKLFPASCVHSSDHII